MAYIVTRDGRKMPVDDSSINYEEDLYYPWHDVVAVCPGEDVRLKKVWILQLQKDLNESHRRDRTELELIKELKYNHEPTKEEVYWAMHAFGTTWNGIATIIEGYELD